MSGRQLHRRLAAYGTLALLFCATTARADLSLTPTVTFDSTSGLYSYDYTISNLTGSDVSLVNIYTAGGNGLIRDILTPAGFGSLYDSKLGIVTFFEDTMDFSSGSVLSGFTFLSPNAPTSARFDALTTTGESLVGSTLAPVPEPGTVALLCAAGAGLLTFRLRKRALHR